MEFGNILAKLRKQKGQNQRELADSLGVSNGAVAMWETNKRQPDLEMLKKIANYFDVSIDYLLEMNSSDIDSTSVTELSSQEIVLLNLFHKYHTTNDLTEDEASTLKHFFTNAYILSSEEQDLIDYYSKLSIYDKRWIMGQMIDLIKKSEEQKSTIPKVQ